MNKEEKKSEYNRKYWNKHRKEISQKRRKKYKDNQIEKITRQEEERIRLSSKKIMNLVLLGR